jgi:hypothetical protein
MRKTWGAPERGCSHRDPTHLALRFATEPAIVAVREDTALSIRAFDEATRADRELAPASRCALPQ